MRACSEQICKITFMCLQKGIAQTSFLFLLQKIKKLSAVLAGQEPFDTRTYAYIANVCVAKFARRRGIALNMLYLAADVATMAGFVHILNSLLLTCKTLIPYILHSGYLGN